MNSNQGAVWSAGCECHVESRLGNLIDDLCGTAFFFCVGNSKKSIGH